MDSSQKSSTHPSFMLAETTHAALNNAVDLIAITAAKIEELESRIKILENR